MTAAPLISRKPLYWFLLLATLIPAVELLVTRQPRFAASPALALGVTLDLVLLLPALYYLLIVRPYRVGWFTMAGMFGLTLGLAGLILPAGQQHYLGWFRQGALLAEPALLVLVLLRLRKLRHHYRLAAATQSDVQQNLETSFRAVFGHPLTPLASELLMVRYALLFWRRARPATAPAFTQHQDSAVTAMLATLLLATGVEMTVAHLLIGRWYPTAAYGLLALSGYSLLWLLGHLQAVRQRPLLLTESAVLVRVGLVWNFALPRTALAAATRLLDSGELPKTTLNLAKTLLTPPNVLLTCHHPISAVGPYGIRQSTRQLALYVDSPADFIRALGLPGGA